MVDACSAFFFIVVLSSAHCWFNTVVFHTKCFHCFLPVLCFMMAILAVNRDLIFKVGDLGCSAAFSSIVVLPAANSNIY